ncbi:MAG: hypothetical protein JWM78_1862 [Verrucomicrobiaceae bacterium]|nr:hypothetical protein [Verrucomicrobiaceae bacterium]
MIPAGYMAKHIHERPEWLKAPDVSDIYSVSNCVSDDFSDYINYWKHNGYWLFNSPAVMRAIATENNLDISSTKLFYYEVYDLEYDENDGSWRSFNPESSFQTEVEAPLDANLEGYDVVTFYVHTSPECSPLSCNSLACEVKTNAHCLLSSFEEAKKLLESGSFNDTEPGPFRIFAVYSAKWR